MTSLATWPAQAENWLDNRGKAAWIVAMIAGFILFWPVGLALLAYMIWSRRIFSNGLPRASRSQAAPRGFTSSGNLAFDAYKADTLRRLEEEQAAFQSFLDRLRESKDKAEFDAFMKERDARKAAAPAEGDTATPAATQSEETSAV